MTSIWVRGDGQFVQRRVAGVALSILVAWLAGCGGVAVQRPTGLNASLDYFVDASEKTEVNGPTQISTPSACHNVDKCTAATGIKLAPPMRLRVITLGEVHNRYAPSPTTVPTVAVWPVPAGVWDSSAPQTRLDAWDRVMLRFLHGSGALVSDCGKDADCEKLWAAVRSNADYCDVSRYLSDGDEEIAYACNQSTTKPPDRVRVTSIGDVFAQPLLRYPQFRQLESAIASRALLCANIDGAPAQGWNTPTNDDDQLIADGAFGGPYLTFSVNAPAAKALRSSRLKLGGGNWQFAGNPLVVTSAEQASRPQLYGLERDRAAKETACLQGCSGDACQSCYDAGDRLAIVEAWTHVSADVPVYRFGSDGSAIDLPVCTSLEAVPDQLRLLDAHVASIQRDCAYWQQAQLSLAAPDARSEASALKAIARAVAKICPQSDTPQRFTIEFSDKTHKHPHRIDRHRVVLPRADAADLLIAPSDILELRPTSARR